MPYRRIQNAEDVNRVVEEVRINIPEEDPLQSEIIYASSNWRGRLMSRCTTNINPTIFSIVQGAIPGSIAGGLACAGQLAKTDAASLLALGNAFTLAAYGAPPSSVLGGAVSGLTGSVLATHFGLTEVPTILIGCGSGAFLGAVYKIAYDLGSRRIIQNQ